MTDKETIIAILLEASRLLDGRGWNKYSMARDVNGQRCAPSSDQASCYCLSGALVKAWRTIDPEHEEFYFKYFEKKLSEILLEKYNYQYTYTRWNDHVATSKDDVIQLLHCAITSILKSDGEINLEDQLMLHDTAPLMPRLTDGQPATAEAPHAGLAYTAP